MTLLLQAWVTQLVGNRDPEPKKHVTDLAVSWSLGNENVDPGSQGHPDPWDVGPSAFALNTTDASRGVEQLQVELMLLV